MIYCSGDFVIKLGANDSNCRQRYQRRMMQADSSLNKTKRQMRALNEGGDFVFKLLENLDSAHQKILAVAQMYYWIILDLKLCTFGYSPIVFTSN